MENKARKQLTLEIDRKASARNGKQLCEQIAPVIQVRRKQTQSDIMSSASLVKYVENASIKSRLEQVVIERMSWEKDPVTWFVNKLYKIKEEHPVEGDYLLWRYYYDMSDTEYCYTYNIAETTVWRIKERAHVQIAIETGYHEYRYNKRLEIEIKRQP